MVTVFFVLLTVVAYALPFIAVALILWACAKIGQAEDRRIERAEARRN